MEESLHLYNTVIFWYDKYVAVIMIEDPCFQPKSFIM